MALNLKVEPVQKIGKRMTKVVTEEEELEGKVLNQNVENIILHNLKHM